MVGSNVERNRNVKVKKKSPSKESITLIKSQVKTMIKKGSVNKKYISKYLPRLLAPRWSSAVKSSIFFQP